MVKYFKNGVLQVETLDLPQDCGEIAVKVSLEEERTDANYYLEFSCPRNVKYISQKLRRIADKEYEIILPRGISEYIGEVYVQLVIMSEENNSLINRSLMAREPFFVIKESILAATALDSTEKRDFFDYAMGVVKEVENKIQLVDNMIDGVPEQIADKVDEKLTEVTNTMSAYESKIDGKIGDMVDNVASNTRALTEHSVQLEGQQEILTEMQTAMPAKVDVQNVVTIYNKEQGKLYAATYINNSYGKRIRKGGGNKDYTTGNGFVSVGTFVSPATGILILTASTYYSGAQVKKIGIASKAYEYKSMCANDVIINYGVSTTMCCDAKAGEGFEIFVEANSANAQNTYFYNYVLFENTN